MSDPRLHDRALTANELLQDAAIRHAIFIERLKAGEVRAVLRDLDRLYDELIGRTFSVLDRVASRGITTRDQVRLRDLTRNLNRISVEQYNDIARDLVGRMKELAAAESKWQLAAITKASPIGLDLKEPARALFAAIVNNEPFGDPTRAVVKTMRQWFKDSGEDTAFRIQSALDVGLRQGETVQEMMNRIRGTKALGFRDGIVSLKRAHAETWVRTGINNTVTLARERTYEENASVVKAVQLIATLDNSTTLICAGQDGKVYLIGEGPRPPLHPRCRTVTGPVLASWEELGIPLRDLDPSTRASMNGAVPDDLTFGDFAERQSREWQDEYFGPERAELFRSGKVKIEGFTDDRLRTLTVAEILKLEGIAA